MAATDGSDIPMEASDLIEPSLFRITAGLPNRELKITVAEAKECEEALMGEIEALENALSKGESSEMVEQMIQSEFTPPDRCWTVSALLGRLREPMATPLPPNTTIVRASTGKKQQKVPLEKQIEKQKALLALSEMEEYTREHADPASLLQLWKRISSNKTSIVFRKAVNPREAPGYSDRIKFPLDLALLKKMVLARQVTSFADFHERLGLICHNCVKYNGRESDYALVTREFEAYVDELLVTTVAAAADKKARTTPVPAAAPTAS